MTTQRIQPQPADYPPDNVVSLGAYRAWLQARKPNPTRKSAARGLAILAIGFFAGAAVLAIIARVF